MSDATKSESRRLLPRWRGWRSAVGTPEVQESRIEAERPPTTEPNESAHQLVRTRTSEFERTPSLGTALDAVATAFVAGEAPMAVDAAEYILNHVRDDTSPAMRLARVALAGPLAPFELESFGASQAAIAALRARLGRNPRDSLAAMDLARLFASVGETEKAERHVVHATTVAPNSRFVLRGASRFFVHVGDAERAWKTLRRAPVTREDPWLVAAEIAASTVDGRTSTLMKQARALITSKRFSALSLSELRGAIATVEMMAGQRKLARNHFAAAMKSPTENALAQARWATPFLNLDDIPDAAEVPRSYEAAALQALQAEKWSAVVDACQKWLSDEPFSHGSAVLGSYVSSAGLDDFEGAVRFATQGLRANPNEQILRNNLVFALARAGKTDRALAEARFAIPRLMEEPTLIAWTATMGLLNYRLGNAELGRMHYAKAIDRARRAGDVDTAAAAALQWARTARDVGDPGRVEIVSRALQMSVSVRSPFLRRLRELMGGSP